MSSSNCWFLICIQISQEAGQMAWYSHLFQNFRQFVVIHTVKGFGVVNEADVFLEFSCFFNDPMDETRRINKYTSRPQLESTRQHWGFPWCPLSYLRMLSWHWLGPGLPLRDGWPTSPMAWVTLWKRSLNHWATKEIPLAFFPRKISLKSCFLVLPIFSHLQFSLKSTLIGFLTITTLLKLLLSIYQWNSNWKIKWAFFVLIIFDFNSI